MMLNGDDGMDKCPICGGELTHGKEEGTGLEYDDCVKCGERFYFEEALDYWGGGTRTTAESFPLVNPVYLEVRNVQL